MIKQLFSILALLSVVSCGENEGATSSVKNKELCQASMDIISITIKKYDDKCISCHTFLGAAPIPQNLTAIYASLNVHKEKFLEAKPTAKPTGSWDHVVNFSLKSEAHVDEITLVEGQRLFLNNQCTAYYDQIFFRELP